MHSLVESVYLNKNNSKIFKNGFSVMYNTNENGHIEDLINNISNIFENKQIDYEIIVVDDTIRWYHRNSKEYA